MNIVHWYNSELPAFSRKVWCVLLAVAAGFALSMPAAALANGFDQTFTVSVGDFNVDGLPDLYVKGRTSAFVPIPFDDINVPIAFRAVPKDFVLLQSADRTFSIKSDLTPAERSTAAAWPQATPQLVIGDFNVDGAKDIALKGLQAQTGAPDQIVYASTIRGSKAPVAVRKIDEDFTQFFMALYEWILNRESLTRTQYRVVGVEPPRIQWVGSFTSNATSVGVNRLLNLCPANNDCAYSTTKPLGECIKVVQLRDKDGNPIGTGQIDVCKHEYHVWAYARGAVRVAANEDFHADAVAFADIFEDIATGQITDYNQIRNALAPLNSYLGITAPIGTSERECEDAPAVKDIGLTGLGPLVVPVGYGVYYCALGAAVVVTSAAILVRDILDPADGHGMFSNGRATTSAPYTHADEDAALNYSPDPFGDDCPEHLHHIIVLRAQILWRKTDLNPLDKIGYPGHLKRIKILEDRLKELEDRYRTICGAEP